MSAFAKLLAPAALAATLYGVVAIAADDGDAGAGLASLLEREAPISAAAPGLVRLAAAAGGDPGLPPRSLRSARLRCRGTARWPSWWTACASTR